MTSEGLGEMFEGDSADMCAGKFLLVLMGCRAEGLACADPGARTPIGGSGNFMKTNCSYLTPPFNQTPYNHCQSAANTACTLQQEMTSCLHYRVQPLSHTQGRENITFIGNECKSSWFFLRDYFINNLVI